MGAGMHRFVDIFHPNAETSHPLSQVSVALDLTAAAAASDLFTGYKV